MAEQIAESINDKNVLTIVEWSDIVKDVLPAERITIELKPTANDLNEREVTFIYPEKLTDTLRSLEARWGRSEP